MPIETDLSVAPYFDDFSEDKNFMRILYKPDVAVQTREMNQTQSIWQNQLENLGNNIYRRGTIIDGCNFTFHDRYPYIKINDVQLDGLVAIPENYVEYFAESSNGLKAYVLDYADGFESTNSDLKTLFLKYVNSGNSGVETSFSAGDILTVYDSNNSVHVLKINSNGTGYSNSDTIIFTSSLLANVVSGSFSIGDDITDPASGTRGIITTLEDESVREPNSILSGSVNVSSGSKNVTGTGTNFTGEFSNGSYITIYSNSTSYSTIKINVVSNTTFMNLTSNVTFSDASATYANTTNSRVYIGYVPNPTDLANATATSDEWTFNTGNTVVGSTSDDILEIVDIIGENAAGVFVTDFAGRITDATITNRGNGYIRNPEVSLKTGSGSGASIDAQNFIAQVTVSSLTGSVGDGYAFSISRGTVWQKGHFIRVEPQTVVVSKYSKFPDEVAVGFSTTEEIINSNQDTSLLDNVTGFSNINAPGADRLKLEANLVVKDVEEASSNSEFFAIVEWSDGFAYKQNSKTFFNSITDDMATRTKDTSGNFVVDTFFVNTRSPSNTSFSANTINIVVDPGTAYIDGYRVQTLSNFGFDHPKATDTLIETNAKVSLNYENYVRIDNLGGNFEFDRANIVSLYDTKTSYLANTAAVQVGNTAPLGTKIGEARIRNLVFEQGVPGTPNASYRMYLFDVNMNPGKNLKNVKAVQQTGTSFNGVADIILDFDATEQANVAILYGKNNRLLFSAGFGSPLNANNINYVYRTSDDTQEIANTGLVVVSLASLPGKTFPYTSELSDVQKNEIYLAPTDTIYSFANLTGTVTVSNATSNVVGAGTSFQTEIKAGQYIHLFGGASNNNVRRVTSVVNSTFLTIDSPTTYSQASVNAKWTWPKMVPIQLAYTTGYSANVSGANDEILTVSLGKTLTGSSNVDVVMVYNVEHEDPTPTAKTPTRNQLVKLRLANNATGTEGPWCLGIPDIFRLRNVYIGNSSVDSASSTVTSEFFIDNNQNSNYYNLGYLYMKPKSSLVLSSDTYLLVEYDCFQTVPGFFTITSYVSGDKSSRFTEDSKTLADLTNTINTLEIPELFDDKGNYYDLINQIDFRPYVDATANVTSNTAAVTTNPANTVSFSSADRFFPLPDSIYRNDVEYFIPRIDTITIDRNSVIKVIEGTPGSSKPIAKVPNGTMRLNDIYIPSYPALPNMASQDFIDVVKTDVYSNKYTQNRIDARKIKTLFTRFDYEQQQPKNYTNKEIGEIDRRLKNVEYYVALDGLQRSVKDMVIPSSISSGIDRFKYGFFVDDYTNDRYSEINSPEYYASVGGSYATAASVLFNAVHKGDDSSSPYTSVKILSQNFATVNPAPVNPPPPDYTATIKITPAFFKSQTFTRTVYQDNGGDSGGESPVFYDNDGDGFYDDFTNDNPGSSGGSFGQDNNGSPFW